MTDTRIELSCAEVKLQQTKYKGLLLIDCREADEHELMTIKGSICLPMSELQERLPELAGKEAQPLIVYCHHGVRSAQVAARLREQGFSHAVSMAGGIDAWALEIEPGMARY